MQELTVKEISTAEYISREVEVSLTFSDGGTFVFRLREGEDAVTAYKRLKNAADTLATYKRYHDGD